jgi:hypothetical protein
LEAIMRIFLFSLSLLLCMAIVGCGEDDGASVVADAAALHEALEKAGSGDTVRLEAGNFEGSFNIPAGVSLIGDAGGGSVLSFQGEGPVLEVPTEAGKTTLIQDLTVEGGASGGLNADGGGNLEISDLQVSVSGSVGVMVKGLASLTVANLDLTGNVTEADKDGVPIDPDPDRYAIVGLALVKVGQADISQVTAQGFAAYGVVLYESPTVWDGGEVHHLVGTGIQAAGPVEVTLKNLRVHHIWQGATPFGYGIVASHEVHLVTESVTVEDSGLAGMLMDHATGLHTDIKISRSGSRGIWIQHCKPKTKVLDATAVEFTGLENQLDDIRGVAFGVFMSEGISLSNAQINETKKITMAALGAGEAEIGDGIELIGSNNLEFNDVTLNNNERAGVVVDGRTEELNESDTTVAFNNVEISGDGDRGFAEQNGTATSAPEVVTPALQQADAAGGFLDVAAGLDVTNLPDPEGYIDIDI